MTAGRWIVVAFSVLGALSLLAELCDNARAADGWKGVPYL